MPPRVVYDVERLFSPLTTEGSWPTCVLWTHAEKPAPDGELNCALCCRLWL